MFLRVSLLCLGATAIEIKTHRAAGARPAPKPKSRRIDDDDSFPNDSVIYADAYDPTILSQQTFFDAERALALRKMPTLGESRAQKIARKLRGGDTSDSNIPQATFLDAELALAMRKVPAFAPSRASILARHLRGGESVSKVLSEQTLFDAEFALALRRASLRKMPSAQSMTLLLALRGGGDSTVLSQQTFNDAERAIALRKAPAAPSRTMTMRRLRRAAADS
ncbi:hypothetical protein M885DRAFT_512447 [Pelagophyceae sp. CCMP2097]|nr:hypothetical protein M885DRAFT_512447 [Pelagophyceae sp. CCMP2097]|mmetsp:Transcript_15497/g.52264  ORF Transcript_15497/g.52264 Transcript_15497/m.52264 type:complete len:223 (-) Transcript_15497:50-718(-)